MGSRCHEDEDMHEAGTLHVTLSKGERLLLVRRQAGMTQAAMAALFGVPVFRLKLWEYDERDDVPVVKVGAFHDRDWCFFMRRRQGWLLRELAERTGLAAKWLHRAERGEVKDVRPLVTWWAQWLAAKEDISGTAPVRIWIETAAHHQYLATEELLA